MTRLARHDEIVEGMARAIHEQHDVGQWEKSPAWQKIWRADAAAALDALLTAVVELGVGREAVGYPHSSWIVDATRHTPEDRAEFPALILQLEDKP